MFLAVSISIFVTSKLSVHLSLFTDGYHNNRFATTCNINFHYFRSMADAPLKCVIVGDEEAGKIKLLQSMCRMVDPGRPSQRAIYEGHTITAMVDNRKYVISLWDTSGQEEYETIRQLSYRDADIYLVCFSLVQPTTFHNVQEMVRICQQHSS